VVGLAKDTGLSVIAEGLERPKHSACTGEAGWLSIRESYSKPLFRWCEFESLYEQVLTATG